MIDFALLKLKLKCVCLFKNVLKQAGVSALINVVDSDAGDEKIDAWVAFYGELLKKGKAQNSSEYIFEILARDCNELSKSVAAGKTPGKELLALAQNELSTLSELASLEPQDFNVSAQKYLPKWQVGKANFGIDFITDRYKRFGYGVFSDSTAFNFNASAKTFEAIHNVSQVRLTDLKEYGQEKQVVMDNTRCFINGLPANNVLLYGDRGTGKSSTVHAILNELSGQGLRLIEVTKAAIPYFPMIMQQLAAFSNKFIIFLDDLTFIEGADDYACLKAALEGSVGSKNANVLIYATTNRRHLLKESAADRSDDIHAGDTREEQLSLSDRFGLVVTFINPSKKEFFTILKQILADRNLHYPDDELSLKAEQYALTKGGRSPRAAHQLADMLQTSIK